MSKLYAYYSRVLSNKIGLKLGVAAELSHPKVGDLETTYIIYQPHLDLKFDLHKFLSLKLKYRAHSRYPRISQSIPFMRVIDDLTTEVGNPFLKPELTHGISLNIKGFQGLVVVEPYFNYSDNRIIRGLTPLEDNTFEYSYTNAKKFTNTGLKTNITAPLFGKSLLLQTGLQYEKSSITFNDVENSIDDWVMNSQLIYMNEKHDFVGLLIYQKNLSKFITAQGYTSDDVDFWMLYFQKNFFKKRLTVEIGYLLPLDFGTNFTQEQQTQVGAYHEMNATDVSLVKNIFMFGVKFRFNKGHKIRKSEKDIEKVDEKESQGLF